MKNIELIFEPTGSNKTKGKLVAKQNSEILHTDVIDIAKDKDRTAFIKGLEKLVSDLNTDQVRQWMLEEVGRISKEEPTSSLDKSIELDTSRIVRPHLFHIPEVSGLLVPTTRLSGGVLSGNWLLCIQWADGRRECRDLEQYLILPNEERLWFHPMPSRPNPTISSGWSLDGREKWLQGYAPEPIAIYNKLIECFSYFLDFPKEEAGGHLDTLSLWTMLTYAYPAWPAVPYLSIGGPLGSGKSRVFDVLNKIVCRPLPSSSMSAPCLFRTLDGQGGTLLLDEAERLRERSSETGELRNILLSGYKKTGGRANRLEKRSDDSYQPMSFDVYGPKAIAGINELPSALASRCIRIVMFRASKGSEKPRHRIDEKIEVFRALSDDLHAFSLNNGSSFLELAQEMTVCEGMFGRDMEVWQPILALAMLIEGQGAKGFVDMLRSHADSAIEKVNEDTIPEADEIVLRFLAEQYKLECKGVTAGYILEQVKDENEALFRTYSARGIGAILNRYRIRSRRKSGKNLFRPSLEQLAAIEQNYGLDFGLSGQEEQEAEPVPEDF